MNDVVIVSCYLSVSGTYIINSDIFIVGSSDNGLTKSEVNELSRLTATTSSSSNSVQASITLSSYVQSDNGLRLGCSYTVIGGASSVNTDTINIQQASNLFPSFFMHKI